MNGYIKKKLMGVQVVLSPSMHRHMPDL